MTSFWSKNDNAIFDVSTHRFSLPINLEFTLGAPFGSIDAAQVRSWCFLSNQLRIHVYLLYLASFAQILLHRVAHLKKKMGGGWSVVRLLCFI